MKHYLIAFSLCCGLMFSCSGTDESFIDNTSATDSLGQDIDTTTYTPDSTYLPTDTIWVPGDSIYFPVDSITAPGDTAIIRRTLILNR